MLDELVKANIFVHKGLDKTKTHSIYYLRIPPSVNDFLTKFSEESKKRYDEFHVSNKTFGLDDFSSIDGITDVLRKLGFTFTEYSKMFKGVSDASIRTYVSCLKSLHYLNSNTLQNGIETYYINLQYLHKFAYADRYFETERFFNTIFALRGINSFDIHGIAWSSMRELLGKVDKLTKANGWEKKNNQYEKVFETLMGKITYTAYSNKNNPNLRSFRIDYKGSLLFRNDNKQLERGKFAISKNHFTDLNFLIKNQVNEMFNKGEIGFSHDSFPNLFAITKIGYNIDSDEKKIENLMPYQFPKEIPYNDFYLGFTLRYYTYWDKINKVMMVRRDHHSDQADSLTSHSIQSVLLGEVDLINAKVEELKTSEQVKEIKKDQLEIKHTQKSINDQNTLGLRAIRKEVAGVKNSHSLTIGVIEGQIKDFKTRVSTEVADLGKEFSKRLDGIDNSTEQNKDALESKIKNTEDSISREMGVIKNNISDLNTQITDINGLVNQNHNEITSRVNNFRNEIIQVQEEDSERVNLELEQVSVQVDQMSGEITNFLGDIKQGLREDFESFQNNFESLFEQFSDKVNENLQWIIDEIGTIVSFIQEQRRSNIIQARINSNIRDHVRNQTITENTISDLLQKQDQKIDLLTQIASQQSQRIKELEDSKVSNKIKRFFNKNKQNED